MRSRKHRDRVRRKKMNPRATRIIMTFTEVELRVVLNVCLVRISIEICRLSLCTQKECRTYTEWQFESSLVSATTRQRFIVWFCSGAHLRKTVISSTTAKIKTSRNFQGQFCMCTGSSSVCTDEFREVVQHKRKRNRLRKPEVSLEFVIIIDAIWPSFLTGIILHWINVLAPERRLKLDATKINKVSAQL